jgi:hypothetical protein
VLTFVDEEASLPACDAAQVGQMVCVGSQDGSPSGCFNCVQTLRQCLPDVAPPAFVASVEGIGDTDKTLTLPPSALVGDRLVVAIVAEDSSPPPSTPPGWDLVASQLIDVSTAAVFTRDVAAGDGSFTFDVAAGVVVMAIYRGVVAVIDARATDRPTSTTVQAPAIQADGDGILLMVGAIDGCGRVNFRGPPSMTLRVTQETPDCGATAVFIADETLAPSTTNTDVRSATTASGHPSLGISMLLR